MEKYSYRRSNSEWLQLISECRQSGLADNAWCEHNGIKVSSFYNAVSRLRKKACDIPQPATTTCNLDLTSRQDVVQIDICSDSHPNTRVPTNSESPIVHLENSHTLELMVGNACLKICNAADPALLEQVLRMVRMSSC